MLRSMSNRRIILEKAICSFETGFQTHLPGIADAATSYAKNEKRIWRRKLKSNFCESVTLEIGIDPAEKLKSITPYLRGISQTEVSHNRPHRFWFHPLSALVFFSIDEDRHRPLLDLLEPLLCA